MIRKTTAEFPRVFGLRPEPVKLIYVQAQTDDRTRYVVVPLVGSGLVADKQATEIAEEP